jgi:hypothetical protein
VLLAAGRLREDVVIDLNKVLEGRNDFRPFIVGMTFA